MADWFRSDNIPGIEELPITRHAIETLNEASVENRDEVLTQALRALVFATSALETKLNGLMSALGVTENGRPPGQYDGTRDIHSQ